MNKQILKNAGLQALARFITTAIGFFITVIIARHFGANLFGDFSKIISYVGLYYLIVDFGLNAFFVKEPKSFSTLLHTRILIAFISFVFANLIAHILPFNNISGVGFSPFVREGIFLFSFTLFAQAIIFSTVSIFQKNLRYEFFVVSQVVGSLVNLFLICVLILFAKSIEFVIFSYIASLFLTAILSLIFVKEKKRGFDFFYSRKILISSIPLGLMLIFNLIYFRIDIILLSFFKPNSDVAIYAIAYRFFDFFVALPLFLSNALYPKLLENIKNEQIYKNLFNKYLIIYLVTSILIIVPVWTISPLFSLISREFLNAYIPFRILILSLPIFFLTSFFQWVLITLNKQRYLVSVYALSLLLNITFNLVLIPKYSYVGAAVVTLIIEAFVLAFLILKLRGTGLLGRYE